jgi:hypothetical protein
VADANGCGASQSVAIGGWSRRVAPAKLRKAERSAVRQIQCNWNGVFNEGRAIFWQIGEERRRSHVVAAEAKQINL